MSAVPKAKKKKWQAMASSESMTIYKMGQLEELFKKHSHKHILSNEEWSEFKEELLSSRAVNDAAFDSLMMMYLSKKGQYQLGHSFINFVRSINNPNIMTLAHYVCLCGKCISESSESEVLSVFRELHPDTMLNQQVAEPVVAGLSNTNHWRTCIEIIQDIKYPSSSLYSHVVSAAFKNEDYDTAWKLLSKMEELDLNPNHTIFEQCVLSLMAGRSNQSNAKNVVTQMLHFCKKKRILISNKCATDLKLLIEQLSTLKGNFVTIKGDVCSNCSKHLEQINLNESELKLLRDSVVSQVLVGSDIFRHSTPKEVAHFIQFVENIGSCDLVIDGLNVAYKNKSENKSRILLSVISCFSGKKILMVGKRHMMTWPKNTMSTIRKKVACFFADNLSKDDPFFLYAALVAGSNFVSSDLLRDHRFKLQDNKIRELFDRWRLSRQILYPGRLDKFGKPTFVFPLKQDINVQGDWESGWHVPYKDYSQELGPYDYCTSWLCFAH